MSESRITSVLFTETLKEGVYPVQDYVNEVSSDDLINNVHHPTIPIEIENRLTVTREYNDLAEVRFSEMDVTHEGAVVYVTLEYSDTGETDSWTEVGRSIIPRAVNNLDRECDDDSCDCGDILLPDLPSTISTPDVTITINNPDECPISAYLTGYLPNGEPPNIDIGTVTVVTVDGVTTAIIHITWVNHPITVHFSCDGYDLGDRETTYNTSR